MAFQASKDGEPSNDLVHGVRLDVHPAGTRVGSAARALPRFENDTVGGETFLLEEYLARRADDLLD